MFPKNIAGRKVRYKISTVISKAVNAKKRCIRQHAALKKLMNKLHYLHRDLDVVVFKGTVFFNTPKRIQVQ